MVRSIDVSDPRSGGNRFPPGRLKSLLLAASGYLSLSLIVWSNVWTSSPTSTTTCGCGDSSLFTWFLAWPAYAISHGLDPLHSSAAGYPGGVNLLANTSELAVGVVLAPITWLFGPIATLNVALTLAPTLSALSMFVLLRRWVSWAPAAFLGGLCYGFSPFVMVSLVDAHLMLGMAVIPPLVVACLDELLFRQPGRPVLTGVLLGLLVTVQFFIGTEVLMIMVIAGLLGIVLITVYAASRHPEALRRRARAAGIGLAAAGITATVLLSYPAWFALAGPGHLAGLVWPGSFPGEGGSNLKDFAFGAPPITTGFYGPAMSHIVGGSQGPVLSSQYLGFGILVVLIGGMVAWHRDRRLWLFGAIALTSAMLSLGVKPGLLLPWRLAAHLPMIDNVTPSRFVLITYLAVAVLLGVIVDHCHDAVGGWRLRPRWSVAAAGVIVGAVALAPPALYLSRSIPIATQPVVLPTWFRTIAPHLGGRQVLLVLPAPFAIIQSSLTWQAVDGMQYSMVGQGGPGGVLARAGKERAGQTAIIRTTFFFSSRQTVTSGDAIAVRQALEHWGVTIVVVPDQAGLPDYERIRSVMHAAALMTAVTGRPPVHQADAWVWTGVDSARPTAVPSSSTLLACTAGLPYQGVGAVRSATACLLAALHRGAG